MKPHANPSVSPEQRLCPACSLCCNGVIFADVELQRGDNPAQLSGLGLTLERKGRKQCFGQPCSKLSEGLCAIYAERPAQCRKFECRLLIEVKAGSRSESDALRVIRQTRSMAARLSRLLDQCAAPDAALPMSRRFAAAMATPIDLASDPEAGDRRGELMMTANALFQTIERSFLT